MRLVSLLSLVSALMLLATPFISNIIFALSEGKYYFAVGGFFYALFGLVILIGNIMNSKKKKGFVGSVLILLFSMLSLLFLFSSPFSLYGYISRFNWDLVYISTGSVLGIIAGVIGVHKEGLKPKVQQQAPA